MDSLYIFLAGQVVAAVAWAANVNSRVSVLEQSKLDLKELINERFDAIDKRLTRIESAMNGSLRTVIHD